MSDRPDEEISDALEAVYKLRTNLYDFARAVSLGLSMHRGRTQRAIVRECVEKMRQAAATLDAMVVREESDKGP